MSENPGDNGSADSASDDYPETVRARPDEPAEGADTEEKTGDGS
jgi:hypothetical protein